MNSPRIIIQVEEEDIINKKCPIKEVKVSTIKEISSIK